VLTDKSYAKKMQPMNSWTSSEYISITWHKWFYCFSYHFMCFIVVCFIVILL